MKIRNLFPPISHRVFWVWERNLRVWLKYYKASLVGSLGDPLFFLFMGYGLGKFMPEIKGMSFVQYLAPGVVVISAMYSTVFECTFGSFTRMTTQKTYDAIICTPVSIEEVIAGEVFWGATKSFLMGSVVFLVVASFGLIPSGWGVITLPVLILSGMMVAGIALIFTAFAPGYDFFAYFFTLVVTPMIIFSGMFFPVESLPQWAAYLSWFIPLTHVMDIIRGLFDGQFSSGYFGDLAWIAVFTVFSFYAAIYFIKRRLIK